MNDAYEETAIFCAHLSSNNRNCCCDGYGRGLHFNKEMLEKMFPI